MIDDVVVAITRLEHEELPVVRLDLCQLAIDGKTYVDLSARDAIWVATAILRATEDLLA